MLPIGIVVSSPVTGSIYRTSVSVFWSVAPSQRHSTS